MTNEERLLAVLDAWRTTWSPELAALATRIEIEAPPLEHENPLQAARAKQLATLARTSTDLTRASVLAAFRVFAANAHPSQLYVALEGWMRIEPDPRVAAFALTLLTEKGAAREVTHVVSRSLAQCIARHGDSASAARLSAMLADGVHGARERSLRSAVTSLAKRVALPVDPARLAELSRGDATPRRATSKTQDGDALLEAIYADPDDDAPRLAFADWLTESGDPLGEFIVLQINHARGKATAAARKREKVLLFQLRARLLGPLADAVQLTSLRFSRGFLSEAEFSRVLPASRVYELMEDVRYVPRSPDTTWRALKRASAVQPAAVRDLVSRAPRLEQLGVAFAAWETLRPALKSKPPPTLARVQFASAELNLAQWREVLGAPLCARAKTIAVAVMSAGWSGRGTQAPPVIVPAEALSSASGTLEELELLMGYGTIRLLRIDARFSVARLELANDARLESAASLATGLLLGMTREPLDVLEVHAAKPPKEREFRKLIARAAGGTRAVQFVRTE